MGITYEGWGYIRYGAIAYSPSTTHFAWSYDFVNWEDAERHALVKCGCPDSVIVRSGRNGYLVLVLGEKGAYSTGFNQFRDQAIAEALSVCRGYGPNCDVRLVFHAQDPS